MELIVLIKPDIVINNEIADLKKELKKYFTIEASKMIQLDEEFLRGFYYEHVNKDYFQSNIVENMTLSPVIALIISTNGINNFDEINKIKMEIREKFGKDRSRNSIHISDSLESAYKERLLLEW